LGERLCPLVLSDDWLFKREETKLSIFVTFFSDGVGVGEAYYFRKHCTR